MGLYVGFWAATAKSNASNMNIDQLPGSWFEGVVGQPMIQGGLLMNTQDLQGGVSGARGGKTCRVMERRPRFGSRQ